MENTVEGLIVKPQYDLNKFMPGTAVNVKSIGAKDPFYDFNNNCLVISATPLKINVVYIYDNRKRHLDHDDEEGYGSYRTIDIPIDLVAEGKLKLTFLGGK